MKPYVKSNKNDVLDADAIVEASLRPTMRFVEVKSVEQEHVQQVHRVRQQAVKQATALRNQLHALLLEYGIASPRGTGALLAHLAGALEDGDNELPMEGRALLRELGDELRRVESRVEGFEVQIGALARRMPGGAAADDDPGHRREDGDGAGGGGGGRVAVPQRPGDGGVAGAGCRGSTRREAGRGCWASASAATATCARC